MQACFSSNAKKRTTFHSSFLFSYAVSLVSLSFFKYLSYLFWMLLKRNTYELPFSSTLPVCVLLYLSLCFLKKSKTRTDDLRFYASWASSSWFPWVDTGHLDRSILQAYQNSVGTHAPLDDYWFLIFTFVRLSKIRKCSRLKGPPWFLFVGLDSQNFSTSNFFDIFKTITGSTDFPDFQSSSGYDRLPKYQMSVYLTSMMYNT